MKIIRRSKDNFVLRFDKDEEYPQILTKFLKKQKIRGGFFFGLGAFQEPEVAFYDPETKRYLRRKLKGTYEVLSLVGNAAMIGREIFLHQHAVLGKKDFNALGGHFVRAKIGATLEIRFFAGAELKRSKDRKTGLNLLD